MSGFFAVSASDTGDEAGCTNSPGLGTGIVMLGSLSAQRLVRKS